MKNPNLTEIIIQAYSAGVFPMAENAQSPEIFWVDPEMRGIIPLNGFHIPKTLLKQLKNHQYSIKLNTAFMDVLESCAEPKQGRENTWINPIIKKIYQTLHQQGFAHSVEVWDQHNQLIGGLYGVCLGGAFFGESMFSRKPNTSKIALCYLVSRLVMNGFQLLDTQFVTAHLKQFGAIEIPRAKYKKLLKFALTQSPDFLKGESDALLKAYFLKVESNADF